jgi:hypothetical protein
MSVKALALPALLASVLVLAACQAPPSTPGAGIGYSSTSFVVPFDLLDVSWVADSPSVEEPHFVTWEGPTYAVRIINPVTVYPPGGGDETPPPDDYLGYLFGQTEYSAQFADRSELEIDGHPATRMTVTTTDPLDGSIGCPTQGMLADDCFGIQPEYTLTMVVIDVEGTPIVTWLRNEKGTRAEDLKASVDQFDALIAGMTFPDRAPS